MRDLKEIVESRINEICNILQLKDYYNVAEREKLEFEKDILENLLLES